MTELVAYGASQDYGYDRWRLIVPFRECAMVEEAFDQLW